MYYKIDELAKRVEQGKSDLSLQSINGDYLKIQYFDHEVDWHSENRDEFFICLNGIANFSIEDIDYTLIKGNMIIIEAGKRHRASSGGSILLSIEPHERGR
ncbi:MAG: hypothetical protein PHQ86_03930 [Dehalococcoidales bacterium]|nr:hypothetical protein [Dehalococcoidales bacterium]